MTDGFIPVDSQGKNLNVIAQVFSELQAAEVGPTHPLIENGRGLLVMSQQELWSLNSTGDWRVVQNSDNKRDDLRSITLEMAYTSLDH